MMIAFLPPISATTRLTLRWPGWVFAAASMIPNPTALLPVNAMLSLAYSLLTKDLIATLVGVAFDPYLGFYHRPRYGRPSLALDLMEEFRPLVADSVVLAAINTGVIRSGDVISRGLGVTLTKTGRAKLIESYERRMDELVTHPVFGYRISYRRVLEVQARLFARYLAGEIGEFPAFCTR